MDMTCLPVLVDNHCVFAHRPLDKPAASPQSLG